MKEIMFKSQIGETEIDDNLYDYSGMEYFGVIKNFEKNYGKKSKASGIRHDVENECEFLTILYEDNHAVQYKVKM